MQIGVLSKILHNAIRIDNNLDITLHIGCCADHFTHSLSQHRNVSMCLLIRLHDRLLPLSPQPRSNPF